MADKQKTKKTKKSRKGKQNNNSGVSTGNRSLITTAKSGWKMPPKVSLGKSVGPPDAIRMTLKYVEEIQFTGVAAPAAQVWRSSLFDPNLTGVGHQPDFYDQFTAMYNLYCVLGMSAKIECINHASGVGAFIVAAFSDVSTSALSVEAMSEGRYAKTVTVAFATTGGAVRTIKMPYMPAAQIQGQTRIDSDPQNYSLVSTNPGDQWYLQLKCAATDAVTTINVWTKTTIWYDCMFKELFDPGESLFLKRVEDLSLKRKLYMSEKLSKIKSSSSERNAY